MSDQYREKQEQSLKLPYKIIITDCNMPVMDGLEMTQNIKRYFIELDQKFI